MSSLEHFLFATIVWAVHADESHVIAGRIAINTTFSWFARLSRKSRYFASQDHWSTEKAKSYFIWYGDEFWWRRALWSFVCHQYWIDFLSRWNQFLVDVLLFIVICGKTVGDLQLTVHNWSFLSAKFCSTCFSLVSFIQYFKWIRKTISWYADVTFFAHP